MRRERVAKLRAIPDRAGRAHQPDYGNPVTERKTAGRRVRPTARHSEHGEPIEPQCVGELSDVARPVEQLAVGLEIGESIPGTVDKDEPNTGRFRRLVSQVREAGHRRPTEPKDRKTVAGAPLLVAESPAVAELDCRGHAGKLHARRKTD